jgi:hypothetical protein
MPSSGGTDCPSSIATAGMFVAIVNVPVAIAAGSRPPVKRTI